MKNRRRIKRSRSPAGAILLLASIFGIGITIGQINGEAMRGAEAPSETCEVHDHPNIQNEDETPREEEQAPNPEPSGIVRHVTAYNSVEWQTDSTPCIAADGSNICRRYQSGEMICAANFVPLGTVLEVENFGTCTVADRMNARYKYRVDIFLDKDIPRAQAWGLQRLHVLIKK